MMTGPRRDYLHARLPMRLPVHVVTLRSASAPNPSGHTRTRSTNDRTAAGVTVISARCPFPLVASPVANSVPDFSPLRGDTSG